MPTFAMICNHRVIEIIHDVKEAPQWPPDPSGNIVTSVECSEEATRNWVYDSETGSVREPVIPEPEPEPTPAQPTNQDIMDKLDEMSAGQISKADLDAAYAEGVNDVG